MPAKAHSLRSGHIQFYDSYLPLLAAGEYTIAVTQQVELAPNQSNRQFEAVQKFSVLAPRFALPPADVQSVFPPREAGAVSDKNLPQVVLTQPGLPWERRLVAQADAQACPWLALLLFTEDEIIPPEADKAVPTSTLAGIYPVAAVTNPQDGQTLGSKLKQETDDPTTCHAIDLTTEVFRQVTPRLNELPFLAHVRQVEVTDKATDLIENNGWFSVILGNRFPVARTGSSTRNIVHLVSLEGFADYLKNEAPNWQGKTKVRLVSLVSWSFTCSSQGAGSGFARSFQSLLPKGELLRLQLPVKSDTPPPVGSAADWVQKALRQGYAPLTYQTRVGDQTFAWYHGPLVPHPVKRLEKLASFASAAAATIYDAATGTFDLSYAVAWELGRLLALADAEYMTHQRDLRQRLRQRLIAYEQQGAETQPVIEKFIGWLSTRLINNLPRPGAPANAPQLQAADSGPLLDGAPRSSEAQPAQRLVSRATRLKNLLADPNIQAMLQQQMANELQVQSPAAAAPAATNEAPARVAEWLAKLRLLYGVPFNHLVPDARMLPPEAMRFFYVDPNYLNALGAGAQNVGTHSSHDTRLYHTVQVVVEQTGVKQAHRMRANQTHQRGQGPHFQNAGLDGPITGFLLRSTVVSGWPGLEVKAFASREPGADRVPILRLDRLAPDVLLCLFGPSPAGQPPARIEFSEPKEGLAFGVRDGAKVYLRHVSGEAMGEVTGRTVALTSAYYRSEVQHVINVQAWQEYLKQQLSAPPVWGPAAFALQMVRAPEQVIAQAP